MKDKKRGGGGGTEKKSLKSVRDCPIVCEENVGGRDRRKEGEKERERERERNWEKEEKRRALFRGETERGGGRERRGGRTIKRTIGVFRAEIRKQSTMDGMERRGKANRGCWYRTNDNKWHDATPKTVPIYSPEAVSVDNVSPRPLPPSCEPPDKISKIHRPPPEKSTARPADSSIRMRDTGRGEERAGNDRGGVRTSNSRLERGKGAKRRGGRGTRTSRGGSR